LLDIVARVRRVEDDLWSGRRNFNEAGTLRRRAIQEAIDNGHHFHDIADLLRIHPEDVAFYADAPRV
jgi:DNA-binding transcriptional MerR regulator